MVHLLISPSQVRLQVTARPGRAGHSCTVLANPSQGGWAQALQQALAEAKLARFNARVTLSSEFVRHALVPDADLLRGGQERQAAGVHALAQVFGAVARDWRVAVDRSGWHTDMLAVGVDAAVLDTLERVLREQGARGLSIQPFIAWAVHQFQDTLRGDTAWLALLEPGRIVLASFGAGRWRAIRSHRVRGQASGELTAMVDQARLLDELGEAPAQGLVVTELPEGATLPEPGPGVRQVLSVADQWPGRKGGWRRKRLDIDFARERRSLALSEMLLLGCGVAAVIAVGADYARVAGQHAAVQAGIAAADASRRSASAAVRLSPEQDKALRAEVERANVVAARLNLPWQTLFVDLESASGQGVTLLGFEPEGGGQRLRITGEARRMDDVTAFVRRLEGTASFGRPFILGHETRAGGLGFTIGADWRRSHDAPKP